VMNLEYLGSHTSSGLLAAYVRPSLLPEESHARAHP
jgi:hypothetical protein